MLIVIVEDVAKRPLNMQKRSLIVRYVDSSEGISKHAGKHVSKDWGEDGGEDLDEDLDEDLNKDLDKDLDDDLDEDFWYSLYKYRCSRFFDRNTML